jgi:hypothetical protein
MNSEEYHGMILEVFHEVCTNLFLCCKCHWWTILRNLLDVSVVSQHSRWMVTRKVQSCQVRE